MLHKGENVIPKPDFSNETIAILQTGFFYKITSINNHNFNPLEGNFRTFKMEFAKNLDPSWVAYPLPVKAIIYAISHENSFNDFDFKNGNPHITEIAMNRHTTVTFKVKKTQNLKEKHQGCKEDTYSEMLEQIYVPIAREFCPKPCSYRLLPNQSLPLCLAPDFDEYDFICAEEALAKTSKQVTEDFDSFYFPCSKIEYEGKELSEYKIDKGMQDVNIWDRNTRMDSDILMPTNVLANPGNLTLMFSYTFELPERMTVEVENFLVTFEDLIGIVGGTLGVFIGFAFYDNILITLDYFILFWNFAKRFTTFIHSKCLKKETKTKKRTKPIPTKSEQLVPKEQPNIEKQSNNIAKAKPKPEQAVIKPLQTKLENPAPQKQPSNIEKRNVNRDAWTKPTQASNQQSKANHSIGWPTVPKV